MKPSAMKPSAMQPSAMQSAMQIDVAVIGAGPAGAHCAQRLARAGVSVALVDKRSEGKAGAQWLNAVPGWMFDSADLARPVPPELHGVGEPVVLAVAGGAARIHIDEGPVFTVDMRLLGQRLAKTAARAGARMLWDHHVRAVEVVDGRPVAVTLDRDGAETRLEAKVFVDASGMPAVIRRHVPSLESRCPDPTPEHICTAVQQVREVADRAGAEAWMRAHGIRPGQRLNTVAVAGGFSLRQAGVSEDLTTVDILMGAAAHVRGASGGAILRDFLAQNPWVGPVVFGGAAPIPLRRPYGHLIAPGVALLGDAACQVYSSHGSGIGIGLIAARMLSDAVIANRRTGADPGALRALWAYPCTFHRRWGGMLAGADLSRRMTQLLTPAETDALFRSGVVPRAMMLDTIENRRSRMRPSDLPAMALGALRAPRILAKVAPMLARIPRIERLASRYPGIPDRAQVNAWDRRMGALVGS